jgi:hypothetical protein
MNEDTILLLDALRSIRKQAGRTRQLMMQQARDKTVSNNDRLCAESIELAKRAAAWQEAINHITQIIRSIDPDSR